MAQTKYPGGNLAERSGRGGRGGSRLTAAGPDGAEELTAAALAAEGNGAGGLNGAAGAAAGSEARVRQEAEALGLVVSRKGSRRGFRPAAQEDGKVRQTFQMAEAVRRGMEQACSQLNLGYSEFLQEAVVHYFDYLGLRYEGVPRPEPALGGAGAAAAAGGDGTSAD